MRDFSTECWRSRALRPKSQTNAIAAKRDFRSATQSMGPNILGMVHSFRPAHVHIFQLASEYLVSAGDKKSAIL